MSDLFEILNRLRDIEARLVALESKCVGCGLERPNDWYHYTAYNSETKEEVGPLCALCIRGACQRITGPPWKHNGPYRQQ
jgi:predicted transcriptional regulator